MKKTYFYMSGLVCLLFLHPAYAAEESHQDPEADNTSKHTHEMLDSDQQSHGHEEQGEEITLTATQMKNGGIEVDVIRQQLPQSDLLVAGEVKQNGYTSYHVSPRVDSIVLKRHVALGEHVEAGQKLVTLFSETVAQAQADYVDSYTDWQRIKGIGLGSVSDKRIKESQTAYHASIARLRAYGLNRQTIEQLDVDSQNLGEYSLRAETNGTVLADDFNQGQRVIAGEEIIQIADEAQLWVEARLSPSNRIELPAGTAATVMFGEQQFNAKVAQEAHTIDLVTRTRVVRLLANNEAHQLHPGMFVDVLLDNTDTTQLLVPETALIRNAEGLWQVFVQESPGNFIPQLVERLEQHDKLVAISGIEVGTEVVIRGAFFIASQIAKGGFDPHNH